LCFIEMTTTGTGITQPLFPGVSNPQTAQFAGEGIEVQRARLIAGPIQCPR
jgi:hypothetical protein